MTEMMMRRQFVDTLRGYLGAREGDERHRELIDLYNSMKCLPRGYKMTYTADWCVATAVAIGVKLGWEDIILPECSCTRQVAQYGTLGRFVRDKNYVPQIGDFLIYDWHDDNDPDHWGTVAEVDGTKLSIIEGNLSNRVAYRELRVGDQRIYGYCIPDYASRAGFADVAEDAWYAEAVQYCKRHGLMLGKGNERFDPNVPVTRAELACVLMRLYQNLE
jgi:hypothetical protein